MKLLAVIFALTFSVLTQGAVGIFDFNKEPRKKAELLIKYNEVASFPGTVHYALGFFKNSDVLAGSGTFTVYSHKAFLRDKVTKGLDVVPSFVARGVSEFIKSTVRDEKMVVLFESQDKKFQLFFSILDAQEIIQSMKTAGHSMSLPKSEAHPDGLEFFGLRVFGVNALSNGSDRFSRSVFSVDSLYRSASDTGEPKEVYAFTESGLHETLVQSGLKKRGPVEGLISYCTGRLFGEKKYTPKGIEWP